MLTTKQLAKELGLSEKTIRRYQEQNMPYKQVLGANNRPQYRFDLEACKAWIEAKKRLVDRPLIQDNSQPGQVDKISSKTLSKSTSDVLCQSLLDQVAFFKEQIAFLQEQILTKDSTIQDLQKTVDNLIAFNQNNLKQIPNQPTPGKVEEDIDRGRVKVLSLHEAGVSPKEIARMMKEEGYPTLSKKEWGSGDVKKIIKGLI